jgi:hypothetical protein
MRHSLLVALFLVVGVGAQQPPFTLETYAGTTLLRTTTYPSAACDQPSPTDQAQPVALPTEAHFSDQAHPGRDCVLNVVALVSSLPPGTYTGILAASDGGRSDPAAYAVPGGQATTHPCDAPVTLPPSVVEGSHVLGWCAPDLDVNGTPANVTGWALYTNGTRALLANVTAGTTTNAAGQRNYTAPVLLVRGTASLQVAGVNAVGEGAKAPAIAVTVTIPPGVPAAGTIRSVQ